MSTTYTIWPDDRYYQAVMDRSYKQMPLLRRGQVQFGLLLALLVAASTWGWVVAAPWKNMVTLASIFAIGGSLIGIRLVRWRVHQRFRQIAEFGKKVTIVLSEEGLTASAPGVQSRWYWSAYPRSVRFHDGVLLLGSGSTLWLPDSAIRAGSPAQAVALVAPLTSFRRI